MNTKFNDETVISPNTFVISSYVNCPNILKKITPNLKTCLNSSIVFVDLSMGNARLGGSQYCQIKNELNFKNPRFENIELFPYIFNIIQNAQHSCILWKF